MDTDHTSGLLALDPWLAPYAYQLRQRRAHYERLRAAIDDAGGLLGPISTGHHFFGFTRGTRDGREGVWYREWAPGADAVSLTGDFNHWDRASHPLRRDPWGVWEAFFPDDSAAARLKHGDRVKAHVIAGGVWRDRIPAYARRVVQEGGDTGDFAALVWLPPLFEFQHPAPEIQGGLRIYEAHVGMAREEGRVGTFAEFARDVLPRIAALGYNAVQLMAVMEHPYYGSFGYHVSSFFAVSSRFGTPEELKSLIDTAHGLGLRVLLDIVHSHSVKNVLEGLNRFDGTDFQYFHAGARGLHPAWDSLVFDYAKYEVQRFLLSNVRFWLEEFRFDGLRFDGVTSMLYLDHGLNRVFTSYEDYFGGERGRRRPGLLAGRERPGPAGPAGRRHRRRGRVRHAGHRPACRRGRPGLRLPAEHGRPRLLDQAGQDDSKTRRGLWARSTMSCWGRGRARSASATSRATTSPWWATRLSPSG